MRPSECGVALPFPACCPAPQDGLCSLQCMPAARFACATSPMHASPGAAAPVLTHAAEWEWRSHPRFWSRGFGAMRALLLTKMHWAPDLAACDQGTVHKPASTRCCCQPLASFKSHPAALPCCAGHAGGQGCVHQRAGADLQPGDRRRHRQGGGQDLDQRRRWVDALPCATTGRIAGAWAGRRPARRCWMHAERMRLPRSPEQAKP